MRGLVGLAGKVGPILVLMVLAIGAQPAEESRASIRGESALGFHVLVVVAASEPNATTPNATAASTNETIVEEPGSAWPSSAWREGAFEEPADWNIPAPLDSFEFLSTTNGSAIENETTNASSNLAEGPNAVLGDRGNTSATESRLFEMEPSTSASASPDQGAGPNSPSNPSSSGAGPNAPNAGAGGLDLPGASQLAGNGPTIPSKHPCLGVQFREEILCSGSTGNTQPRDPSSPRVTPVEVVDNKIEQVENTSAKAFAPASTNESAAPASTTGVDGGGTLEPSALDVGDEAGSGEPQAPATENGSSSRLVAGGGESWLDAVRLADEPEDVFAPNNHPDPPVKPAAAMGVPPVPIVLDDAPTFLTLVGILLLTSTAGLAASPDQWDVLVHRLHLAGTRFRAWAERPGTRRRAVLASLFARVTRETAALYPVRRMLLNLIRSEPGIFLQELCEKAGLKRPVVVYHARVLEAAGLLQSVAFRKLRHLYVTGGKPELRACFAELRSTQASAVAAYLLENPGASQAILCRNLMMQKSRASLLVARLAKVGLLRVARHGRRTACHPTPRLVSLMGEESARARSASATAPEPQANRVPWINAGPTPMRAARL